MALQYSRYTATVAGLPVSGSSYTGQFGPGSTKNNGGVIAGFGAAVGAGSLSVKSAIGARSAFQMQIPNYVNGVPSGNHVNDSSLLPGERKVVAYAISSGTFAAQAKGNYMIRRVTTQIAGLPNSHTLLSGGSDFGQLQSIHGVNRIRTSFLSAMYWVRTSGTNPMGTIVAGDLPWYSGTTSNQTGVFPSQNSTATNPASQLGDIALVPSAATPGQLVYKGPAPTIVQDLYKSKSSF